MTATALAVVQPHTMIHRDGLRPGSFHAAVREGEGWRTACGELLVSSPRGPIVPLDIATAVEVLMGMDPRQCRRCQRVGDAVADGRS